MSVRRRAVLRGFADVLIALPVLEGCTRLDGLPTAPAREQAATVATKTAKRFIALMCPDGVEPAFWFPKGGETDFQLNTQNAPLEAIRQHLIVTKGIDNKVAIDAAANKMGNGHAEGVGSLLTGWHAVDTGGNNWVTSGGASIDHLIADHHAKQGYLGRVPGIHFGEEAPGTYSAISILANGDREPYSWNTKALFDSPASMTEVAMQNARKRRASILDGSKADFAALSTRVSGEDKRRIDAHLDALRSIEMRDAVVRSCTAPTTATPMDGDQKRELIWDIIVAAMACDATRTATACFYHSGGGGPKLPWIDVLEDIHELSHQIVGAPAADKSHESFTKYHVWWSKKTVSLVQKLKAVAMPGGGTLFDDTVLFQGSEISFNHSCPDMPFLIVAGPQTPFRTRRFVAFPAKQVHTHLLTTLVNAFGLTDTRVGDPAYPAGNLNAALLSG